MKVSKNCFDLIKKYEGCDLDAYICPAGVLTIGWGTTNADKSITGVTITKNTHITQEQADKWLEKSVNEKYAPLVEKYNKKYNFNQNQFDALVSFVYNIGSIDQLTANGTRTIEEISSKIPAYNKAGGCVLKGLERRRNEEKALFDKIPTNTKKVAKKPKYKQMRVIAKNGLNCRKKGNEKAEIIKVFTYNTKLDIIQYGETWCKVKCGNTTGYCATRWLK